MSESEEEDGGVGEPRGSQCSGTDTPFRLERRGNQEQRTVLKSGPSDKRLCKTFAGCHVRGASFVWQTDPGILSTRFPTQSGVYSWPHKFSKGQAHSDRTKQLERQQRAKPLCFIYMPEEPPKKTTSTEENQSFCTVKLAYRQAQEPCPCSWL